MKILNIEYPKCPMQKSCNLQSSISCNMPNNQCPVEFCKCNKHGYNTLYEVIVGPVCAMNTN